MRRKWGKEKVALPRKRSGMGIKMDKGFVYDYLAGIEYPGIDSIYFGRIPLIPLGRWLMGMAVILFVTGIYLSRRRQISVFEMVRFGGRKSWWNAKFRNLFPMGAAACFCYEFCMKGLDLFLHCQEPQGMEEILIFLLWLVHMMTAASIFCLFDLTAFRAMAPAFLLVTEVSTFTVGFYNWNLSKFMFGNWGMYLQSDRIEKTYGFSPGAVMIFQCLIILAVWRAGFWIADRREDAAV